MENEEEESINERQFDFDNGKTISMENVRLYDYSKLYLAILNNTVKYDVKALRRIKSQLYELVKTNKPTERLYIATNIEDKNEDIDFVVGVGVYSKFGKVGYRGIKAEDIYLYAIGESDIQYDDNMILKETIPALYNGKTFWPIRQFVSKCNSIECLNDKVKISLEKSSKDLITRDIKKSIEKNGYIELPCILDYYKKYGLNKTLTRIFKSDITKIDKNDLLEFIKLAIKKEPTLLKGKSHPSRSNFKKCITLWDMLVFSDLAKETEERLNKEIDINRFIE